MFESLPAPESLAAAEDAAVIAAIDGWIRAEAAASARRLAAIAELVARRCSDEDGERWQWSCDYWDAAAAEVSAAERVSHGVASGHMHTAWTLRTRLPLVAALFAEGQIGQRVVTAIVARTDLVDDDTMVLLDADLAECATRWGPLSRYKTEQAIDMLVDRHDPGALRRTTASAAGRDVVIGGRNDTAGISSLWGRLYAADAALLDRRLMAMAHAVCDDDPRTLAQRRADALGALAAGSAHLACGCDGAHCPAAADDGRATSVVVHILAEEPATPVAAEETTTDAEPAVPVERRSAGVILGGAVVPAPLLAELIRTGATVRHLRRPCEAEPRYRPSAALAEFVRMRDLTCRFPNCDVPAEFCDIDHTIPYAAGGLTHPSNLKCECRKHHLLKTFWTGDDGWADRQLADGTVIWTAPTGQSYTTHPGSRILFPTLCIPTGEVPLPTTGSSTDPDERHLMVPKRRRTRAQQRTTRIKAERALNDAHVAERNIPPPF
jgi:hypothetical protein